MDLLKLPGSRIHVYLSLLNIFPLLLNVSSVLSFTKKVFTNQEATDSRKVIYISNVTLKIYVFSNKS